MTFILLTFITAFSIEALGTYVSVIGLSTLFGANPIIIAIAVALDMGKLLIVSMLYTYWNKLGVLMKSYALVAAAVTMTITSAGAMGYLSGEFQKAIMGTQENTLKVDVLKSEQLKLEERKKQIDLQIANLPKNFSNSRIKLMKEFGDEQVQITNRLTQINTDLPALQIAQIGVDAKVGPILYISKAFDVPVEVAVKWVILMIIFVFDPLAVFLIVAGNFLLHLRRTHTDSTIVSSDLFKGETVQSPQLSVPREILPIQVPSVLEPELINSALPVEALPEEPKAPEIHEEPEGPMAKTFSDDFVQREYIGLEEPEHEGPMAKTYLDDHSEHEYIGLEEPLASNQTTPAIVPVTPEVREVITREQLQPPQYFSTLGAVKADDSVSFDNTPAPDSLDTMNILSQYRNYK